MARDLRVSAAMGHGNTQTSDHQQRARTSLPWPIVPAAVGGDVRDERTGATASAPVHGGNSCRDSLWSGTSSPGNGNRESGRGSHGEAGTASARACDEGRVLPTRARTRGKRPSQAREPSRRTAHARADEGITERIPLVCKRCGPRARGRGSLIRSVASMRIRAAHARAEQRERDR